MTDWPDDAAVERALDGWFGPRQQDAWNSPVWSAEIQDDFRRSMRAALIAAGPPPSEANLGGVHPVEVQAMTTLEVLIAARALIAEPQRWTRQAFALDARGHLVDIMSVHAARWDSRGAILRVSKDHVDLIGKAEIALYAQTPPGFISPLRWETSWSTFHADVLARFDRAIEAERGK